jgi:hypothetical protein
MCWLRRGELEYGWNCFAVARREADNVNMPDQVVLALNKASRHEGL